MDTTFSKEDLEFQQEVRTFIKENYPQWLRDAIKEKTRTGQEYTKEEVTAWHKILGKHKGWSVPGWSTEHGGPGFTATQKYIFQEEMAKQDTLMVAPFGPVMCAPVIMTFGSAEQKEKFLPRILSGEDFWCQGYSEPNAGSDLASLKTEAVLSEDGSHYIVNGQKTWTTMAQHADWIFCLVRTDKTCEKPQQGISFLLIDMKSPGIEVRPIYLTDGTHEVNETWFTDVKVPVENLVGQENMGWTYAKFLLAHERSGIAQVGRSKRAIQRIKDIATIEQAYGDKLINDPAFARKIAEVELELSALEYTELRSLAKEAQGKGPGPESSLLKIKGTDLQQACTELAMEAVGYYANPHINERIGSNWGVGPEYSTNLSGNYFNFRKASIYGGSNEIQRNIIAKMVLGL